MSDPIFCAGGCGKSVIDPLKAGWSYLEITGRYRCGACEGALRTASTQAGATPDANASVDPLPCDSIGALKKMPARPPLHEKAKLD